MKVPTSSYHGYRFPPDIISNAVWLYYRPCPSFRNVEDLVVQRGVIVSYETIRQWSSGSPVRSTHESSSDQRVAWATPDVFFGGDVYSDSPGDSVRRKPMKRTWHSAFLAGFLAGVVTFGVLVALTYTNPAGAQPVEPPHEQIQIMREMSASLKGIEGALQKQCP